MAPMKIEGLSWFVHWISQVKRNIRKLYSCEAKLRGILIWQSKTGNNEFQDLSHNI